MKGRVALLLILWIAVARETEANKQETVVPTLNEGSFYVAGYSIRTNNTDELSGRGRIGKLWSDFTRQNLGTTIPHRVDQRLIVVYSEYSSNERASLPICWARRCRPFRTFLRTWPTAR
jgi:hypothetical protein